MSDDFYPFVDSGDPAPDNTHLNAPFATVGDGNLSAGASDAVQTHGSSLKRGMSASYATRIAIYDDMLSTPRVIVIAPNEIRPYLEEITNTVYRCMREQGGKISLMVIREIVENFIHAHFVEPIISILDDGSTIRFADQGPGIDDKERAFDFGVTSADQHMKRYIRGTGAGFPMIQQYLETSGGIISIEDNMNAGTVVTISVDADRICEIERARNRGAAVHGICDTQCTRGMSASGALEGDARRTMAGAAAYGERDDAAMAAHEAARFKQPSSPSSLNMASFGEKERAESNDTEPFVSKRERLALSYLLAHGQAGPTELVAEFGYSGPTWSRELSVLNQCALVTKHGQKYILTKSGTAWIQAHHGYDLR